MQGRMWGNEYRMTLVCVDSYEQGVLSGRLYNPYLSEGASFHSLMEFLRIMEGLLDGMNFPQPFTSIRSFQGNQGQKKANPPTLSYIWRPLRESIRDYTNQQRWMGQPAGREYAILPFRC